MQGLASVHTRHVQIQKQQAGTRGGVIGRIIPPLVEVIHQLDAVMDEAQSVGKTALGQRLARQFAIIEVIVGDENGDPSFEVGHDSSPSVN